MHAKCTIPNGNSVRLMVDAFGLCLVLVYKSFSQGGLRPDSKRVLEVQLVFFCKLHLSTYFIEFWTAL